jgi:hypothetical protein
MANSIFLPPLRPLLAKEGIKGRFPLFIENLLYSHSIPDIINQVFYQYLYRHERTTGYNQMASYYKKGSGNARLG